LFGALRALLDCFVASLLAMTAETNASDPPRRHHRAWPHSRS